MVEYKEGHKNSKGEDAPWCIVSHETGKVISSHKSKSSAESHLKDIQKFKHMKNEAVMTIDGLKVAVVEALSKFKRIFHYIEWSSSGDGDIYAFVYLPRAKPLQAENLANLFKRILSDKLRDFDVTAVPRKYIGGGEAVKLRFERKRDMNEKMTIEKAKEILKESGKKTVNESYLEEANVEELYSLALESLFFADQVHLWHWTCKSGFHHTHLEEVYKSLRDFADELVEICLASGKKFAVKANTRELGGDGDFDVQDAIDELEEFIDEIQATGKVFKEESEITTLLDDEAKALTKEVGLLKNFQ